MPISLEIQLQLESKKPGRAVFAALEKLLHFDAYLLNVNVNERSISHRFGMYLQAELPDFDVDCEYNRTGEMPKRICELQLDTDIRDTDGKTVYPDVIVHKRGCQDRNYLVVEFKKTTSPVSKDFDLEKLRGYKGDERLKYEFGLFVELKVEDSAGVSFVQWI